MTSKERVIGAIERTPIDRVPKYEGFWEDTLPLYIEQGLALPVQKTITIDGEEKKIGSPIEEYFDYDIQCLYMDVSMRFPRRLVSDENGLIVVEDQCGYTAKKFKGKASSIHFLSHKVNDENDWEKYKERFAFNPNDTARVDSEGYFLRTKPYPTWDEAKIIYDEYRKNDKFLAVFGYGPYEATWRHHGYEESLMDIIAEPEMMMDMFEKATNCIIETTKHMIKMDMKPDAIWIAEDMGSTATTLFSPTTYKECLWPYHKKIGDFLRENNIYYFMHSCGNIKTLIPDLIEAKLDVIQALQANTGMNVADMKKEFGDKITFFGNIGEQEFAKGEKAIEEEMRKKIIPAMQGGGYIYHSDHSIPPEVPLKTYEYAMKVLSEIGSYK